MLHVCASTNTLCADPQLSRKNVLHVCGAHLLPDCFPRGQRAGIGRRCATLAVLRRMVRPLPRPEGVPTLHYSSQCMHLFPLPCITRCSKLLYIMSSMYSDRKI
jgi:hypothetical protein